VIMWFWSCWQTVISGISLYFTCRSWIAFAFVFGLQLSVAQMTFAVQIIGHSIRLATIVDPFGFRHIYSSRAAYVLLLWSNPFFLCRDWMMGFYWLELLNDNTGKTENIATLRKYRYAMCGIFAFLLGQQIVTTLLVYELTDPKPLTYFGAVMQTFINFCTAVFFTYTSLRIWNVLRSISAASLPTGTSENESKQDRKGRQRTRNRLSRLSIYIIGTCVLQWMSASYVIYYVASFIYVSAFNIYIYWVIHGTIESGITLLQVLSMRGPSKSSKLRSSSSQSLGMTAVTGSPETSPNMIDQNANLKKSASNGAGGNSNGGNDDNGNSNNNGKGSSNSGSNATSTTSNDS